MKNEIWKAIEGYEGLYQVSNLGRVRSLDRTVTQHHPETGKDVTYVVHGQIMAPYFNVHGYQCVRLRSENGRRTFLVHRLVAKAFVPNPNGYDIVNHKDESRDNNHADNLEWCTQEYNVNYGTSIQRLSESHINRSDLSKTVEMLSLDGELLKEFPSAREAARFVGASNSNISRCCRDHSKTCKGYRWRYKQ